MTAVVLAAEIGDFKCFRTPKQLMAYLGLVPSEHSSGCARRQGGITRTGNRHARWVLVEAAWNYRFGPCASRRIKRVGNSWPPEFGPSPSEPSSVCRAAFAD